MSIVDNKQGLSNKTILNPKAPSGRAPRTAKKNKEKK